MENALPDGMPDPPTPLPVAAGGSAGMTKCEKAAVLMRLLLNEDVRLSLAGLPDSSQVQLTEMMAGMRIVKRSVAREVASEFLSELMTIGLTNSNGLEGAIADLDGVISETTVQRMRRDIGLKAISDPWQRLEQLDDEKLRPMLMGESNEIAAVVLSKLSVARAAALLSSLPGDVARKITWAMSMTGSIGPDAIERIGLSLASQLDARVPVAFEEAAENRVGAILNLARPAVRDEVLDSLDTQDREFAREVRRSIFTFAHIGTRLESTDVSKVLRNVDPATQVTAFAWATRSGGDNEKSVEFMLSQISSRLSDTLREDMAALGEIKEKDGDRAMGVVVAELRRLADKDEIILIEVEEEENQH